MAVADRRYRPIIVTLDLLQAEAVKSALFAAFFLRKKIHILSLDHCMEYWYNTLIYV